MLPYVAPMLKPGISYEAVVRKDLENGNYHDSMGGLSKEAWLEGRLQAHKFGGATTDLRLVDGRWIRFEQHQTPDGKKVGVRTDITDVKNAADSFRLLFDNNPVPMFVYNKDSLDYIDVNNAAVAQYGYSRERFLTMNLADIRPPADRQRLFDYIATRSVESNGELDWTHVRADGTEIIVNTYARPIKYQGIDAALATAIDVTERRKYDASIKYQANHDSLTDLPNRRFFLECIESTLLLAQEASYTGIILIDIDDFKSVNDTLGHQIGDDLIKRVAEQLKEFIGERGTVGRLGGDEYAILLSKLVEPDDAETMAAELIGLFSIPLNVQGREIQVGVSAGVALGMNSAISAATLLMNADLALYKAKSDGRGVYRLYEPQMSLQLIQYRIIEQDLRHALDRNQLEVHYQPLIGLDNGAIIGFEALLRWKHPERGMIPPASFIPIAESNGMILPIGNWVLQQACTLAATLKNDMFMAVNVSPMQFKSGKLAGAVIDSLKLSGLPPHLLELEITESILLEKSPEMLEVLRHLKALGISIALDDFGTGFSSLGYLNNFPIDKIKIDRSFVIELGVKPKSEVLIRAALSVGQSLGVTTLAEGIETQEQYAILRALGCNQGQGYLISPAIPASQIPLMLKQNEKLHSKRATG
jgi:diguanylate cyclase (GGDEF)-like protein/PAS domain S-box-containing protein